MDAATLTGAIVVALGTVNVGAFTNNEEFLQQLLAAAKAEGEKMWQLPLDEEYKEQLKSAFADLHNIGGRPAGGSITAAMVPARVCRRHALGAPGYRGHRLAGRCEALHGERPLGSGRAHVREIG